MKKICIISSWTENINIVKLCQSMSIECTLIIDSLFWPYQDKDHEFIKERCKSIIKRMSDEWITKFIVSPAIELELLEEKPDVIIPLFSYYIRQAFNNSLTWKIGFMWWYSEITTMENIWEKIKKNYKPNENQKKIKKFKLSKWLKDTTIRWYLNRILSPRNMMINKIIKNDLKYFKDANIDTIIPLDYSYFNYKKTITSFFNQKKQKFNDLEKTKELLKEFSKVNENTELKEIVYYTWPLHIIWQDKKRESILSQWWKRLIEYKKIII